MQSILYQRGKASGSGDWASLLRPGKLLKTLSPGPIPEAARAPRQEKRPGTVAEWASVLPWLSTSILFSFHIFSAVV